MTTEETKQRKSFLRLQEYVLKLEERIKKLESRHNCEQGDSLSKQMSKTSLG